MEDTKLLMTIPKDVITAQVRAAVATALAKDPEALVAAVVSAAMSERRHNAYSSDKPIWDEKVNAMIREVAEEAFKGWLDEQRPKIKAAVLKRLKTTGDLVESIAAKFTDKIASSFSVSVNFTDRDR